MTKCFSAVRGRAMRATLLDGCGNPVLGPISTVATEGFITVGFTSNIQEGEVIEITNAAGKICISDRPAPKFVNYTIAITLCGVDPDLIHLLTGSELVLDGDDEAVGFRVNSGLDLDAQGFALELWTGVPSDACEEGTGSQYGYTLVPFIKGGVLGDFTIENGAVTFSISGSQSKDGTQWGVGPYDVVADETGLAGPLLTPLGLKDHLHMQLTTIAPPTTDECGAIALGVPATGAVAGTPGTTTPANSYAPASLATIGALTASPNTAWTTGQRIVLRDGTTAHWTGSAWAAGPA